MPDEAETEVSKLLAKIEIAQDVLKTVLKRSYDGTAGGDYQEDDAIEKTLLNEMARAHGSIVALRDMGRNVHELVPNFRELLCKVVALRHVPGYFRSSETDGKSWQEKARVAREVLSAFHVDLRWGEAREAARARGVPSGGLHPVALWGLGRTYQNDDAIVTDVLVQHYVRAAEGVADCATSYWKIHRRDLSGADIPVEQLPAGSGCVAEPNPLLEPVYDCVLQSILAAQAWAASSEGVAAAQDHQIRGTMQLASDNDWCTEVRSHHSSSGEAANASMLVSITGHARPAAHLREPTINYAMVTATKDHPAYLQAVHLDKEANVVDMGLS